MRLSKGKAALALLALLGGAYWAATHLNSNWGRVVGEPVDAFNGVAVYYNGGVQNVEGRNLAPDGYNLGLRYQCVEFVKRYYYQRFGHKMPQDKGHARDFFQSGLDNGALNPERGLLQYRNGGGDAPRAEDLIVFAPWTFNRYGHVAIVSRIGPDFIEIIQQNPGPFGEARERLPLLMEQGVPRVDHPRALGWLRRAPQASAPAGEGLEPAGKA
ncbi:CHAP domain-containing protein [Chromobacterium alkanivorans]|uniref:CHAP domain-containing protein n=1 Tax=Chromobacterium alkanivorans TaxID=1071719 RepID=UPI001968186E|nr:CHAP domain-containing protein [Chromobacterium alkanivorans]MBN3003111.1 CHAP domain-containing protein [Chromobacterium alkanivorans]